MSLDVSSISKLTSIIGLAEFLAEQYLKHKAESQGITVEQALDQAAANYEAAKKENKDLKDLGHE